MRTHTTRVQRDGAGRRLFRRKFQIQVIEGPDRGRSHISGEESASVGSSPHNDLALTDPAVSRHHLRVEVDPRAGFVITDLGSTNGTTVAGLGLRQIVADRAVDLELGQTVLRFSPLAEEAEVALPPDDHFGSVLGCSPIMLELFGRLRQASRSDVTVLLEGETGTGKEIIAQELHRHSPRAAKPFIIVDCGAIPPGLIESELFGHVRGSFTSATSDRLGAFEEASGGTVFLDEIGELDLAMQPQLLRVLERRQVKRLGESRYRDVDVRVIAATNRDLQREVNQKTFRADLFYRLAVVRLRVPPLRQRPEDVELLVRQLLPDVADRLGLGGPPPSLNAETLQQLIAHPWPGNVRELRNFLERLVTLSRGASPLDPADALDLAPSAALPGVETPEIEAYDELPFKEAKTQWMARFDIVYLTRLLSRCEGNVAEAARQSGVDRVHLFRLIKKYGLRSR